MSPEQEDDRSADESADSKEARARGSNRRGMNGDMDFSGTNFPREATVSTDDYLMLACCAVLLIATILFAKFSKSGR